MTAKKERLSWERCEVLCTRVFNAIDWAALGDLYFNEDGEAEWEHRRDKLLEFGFEWARALFRRVPEEGGSLYVGAGVAELPVMIAEACLRGRKVRATNLRVRECEILGDALRRHQLRGLVEIEAVDAGTIAAEASYDHLGCVSLFTDPQTWPHLSDVTYGRVAPVQIDVGQFEREREEARVLARSLFDGMTLPGWITTTVEEVSWFLELASQRGVDVAADEDLLPTAVVGDPIGFLHCESSGTRSESGS